MTAAVPSAVPMTIAIVLLPSLSSEVASLGLLFADMLGATDGSEVDGDGVGDGVGSVVLGAAVGSEVTGDEVGDGVGSVVLGATVGSD